MNQLDNGDLSVLAKLFGALFYYPPKDYAAANLSELLSSVDTSLPQLNVMLESFTTANEQELQLEHDRLFSGIGEMPAAPWGSVYLDKEQVVFGTSTINYRDFLTRCGFELQSQQKEPEDQVGLMLMVLGMLIESQQDELATELLEVHLMTWFNNFNQRFKIEAKMKPYLLLSDLSDVLLQTLCQQYQIVSTNK
ncbi:TorD/DmsD family molecular chaperone [Vibrio gallicus]|uniref:TorD/DmsD family molecular chaperone n=1 Tax=Vibrio gallicus TaxID=190897 RepID=UPI0021C34AB2|nr:molecular chaperone TorD family protein [Vibrio gallicus]